MSGDSGVYKIETASWELESIYLFCVPDYRYSMTPSSGSCCCDFPLWWTETWNCEPKKFSLKLLWSEYVITVTGKETKTYLPKRLWLNVPRNICTQIMLIAPFFTINYGTNPGVQQKNKENVIFFFHNGIFFNHKE